MVKKLQLEYDDENPYYYLGISSSIPDYQLIFDLNKHLKLKFRRVEAFQFSFKKAMYTFSLYTYVDEENMINYYFISNKDRNNRLSSQYKHLDYFLIVEGEISEEQIKTFARDIMKLPRVMLASQLEAEHFEKIQDLRYEFDMHIDKVLKNK